MVRHLKSLRHVEYRTMASDTHSLIKGVFSRIATGLESIEVAKISQIGIDDLLRHGSTLRKLWMHCTEYYLGRMWREDAVQESAMTWIRDACVVLEKLDVDVVRAGDEWPYAMLDIIASFPRLRHLGRWFEIGLRDLENPVRPCVTASAARHLLGYLLSRSTEKLSRLRSIVIQSGTPPALGPHVRGM